MSQVKEFACTVDRINSESVTLRVAGFSLEIPMEELFATPPSLQDVIVNNIKLNLAIAGASANDCANIKKIVEKKAYKGIEG